jgi:hypothetical protein
VQGTIGPAVDNTIEVQHIWPVRRGERHYTIVSAEAIITLSS